MLLPKGVRPEEITVSLDPQTGEITRITGMYDSFSRQATRGLTRKLGKAAVKSLLEGLLQEMQRKNFL